MPPVARRMACAVPLVSPMRLATAFASVVLLIACEKAERPGIYQAPGSDAGLGFARDVRVATDTGPACTGEGIRCDGQTP